MSKGLICESLSLSAIPALLVPKKDGGVYVWIVEPSTRLQSSIGIQYFDLKTCWMNYMAHKYFVRLIFEVVTTIFILEKVMNGKRPFRLKEGFMNG